MLKNPKGYEVTPHQAEHLVATAGRPVMIHQLLRRCANCHAPHPLARKPKLDLDHCPDCGHASSAGPLMAVDAKMTGFMGAIANWMFDVADWLTNLSKRI